jgi:hypothetical protein
MSSTGFEGTKDELAGLLGVKDPEPVKKKRRYGFTIRGYFFGVAKD